MWKFPVTPSLVPFSFLLTPEVTTVLNLVCMIRKVFVLLLHVYVCVCIVCTYIRVCIHTHTYIHIRVTKMINCFVWLFNIVLCVTFQNLLFLSLFFLRFVLVDTCSCSSFMLPFKKSSLLTRTVTHYFMRPLCLWKVGGIFLGLYRVSHD